MGIALVVIGSICIASPFIATVTSVVVFGFLLLAAGITQIVSSFWSGKWSGMLLHLLVGVLYAVVGFMIIDAPVENTLLLTKLIAIFLIVTGIFESSAHSSIGFMAGAGCCSTAASRCCWAC